MEFATLVYRFTQQRLNEARHHDLNVLEVYLVACSPVKGEVTGSSPVLDADIMGT